MNSAPLKPVTLRPGEARVYDHIGGEKMTMLLSKEDTGGAFAMFIDEVPPGGGPPMHVHDNEDETFYILAGQLEMQINEERFTAGPGSSVYLPQGVPHTFGNTGTETARALVVLTPAGLEGMFVEVEPLVTQREPDMTAILGVAGKYGIEVVGPPLAAVPEKNGQS